MENIENLELDFGAVGKLNDGLNAAGKFVKKHAKKAIFTGGTIAMLANPLGNATAQTTVHCPDFEREWISIIQGRANEQLHYDIANNGERFRAEVWEANPGLVSPPDGLGRASIHNSLLQWALVQRHLKSVNEMLNTYYPNKVVTMGISNVRQLRCGRLSRQRTDNRMKQVGIMRIERIVE